MNRQNVTIARGFLLCILGGCGTKIAANGCVSRAAPAAKTSTNHGCNSSRPKTAHTFPYCRIVQASPAVQLAIRSIQKLATRDQSLTVNDQVLFQGRNSGRNLQQKWGHSGCTRRKLSNLVERKSCTALSSFQSKMSRGSSGPFAALSIFSNKSRIGNEIVQIIEVRDMGLVVEWTNGY